MAFWFLFFVLPLFMSLLCADSADRSFSLSLTENGYLQGHVIQSQRTYDLMACVQLCLAQKLCFSLNYENIENGLCEINRKGAIDKTLTRRPGYVFGQLMKITACLPCLQSCAQDPGTAGISGPINFTFTTLGAIGHKGPTNTAGYNGACLEGQVHVNSQGIQLWNVPYTGSYVIEALGASGTNGTCTITKLPGVTCSPGWNIGGRGAKMKGTFSLQANTRLKILVGQKAPLPSNIANEVPGGGGGGTFVTLTDNTPLIIAGGGGGGGITVPGFGNGDPGQVGGNGTRHGGTGGRGGNLYDTKTGKMDTTSTVGACSGGGLLGDGTGYQGLFSGPKSFVNGGEGGRGPALKGGFGGGGFGMRAPGGGGGYSGGGVEGSETSGIAGGGGSFNAGIFQDNISGVNEGHGKVIISFINY